jgi:hypothetical protein
VSFARAENGARDRKLLMPVFSTAPSSSKLMSSMRMSSTPSGTIAPARQFSLGVFLAVFLIAGTAAPVRVCAQTAARQLPAVQSAVVQSDSVPSTSARSHPDPAAALADALIAACRQDPSEFATHLTAEGAAAFRALPQAQRTALLRRFVLLDDPGKPLLSADAAGHTRVRCEAGGVVSDMHFGATQMQDNLAFIPVEVPEAGAPAGEEKQSVRFGLVRESGEWKLLSLGLLLLDIPALAREWEANDISALEGTAIAHLREIAEALKSYQAAYGKLPDTLAELGPSAGVGASPDKAGLLDEELASGENGGYDFRYSIVTAPGEADESERDKTSGFQLAATPKEYGHGGRKSFYLDAQGVLRGADKSGSVADENDPRIAEPPQNQP